MFLGALAVLVLNDHWGKPTFGNLLTGKLSDVAGLVVFPVFLVALAEWAAGRRLPRLGLPAAAATALAFTLVKTWAPAHAAYEALYAALWWPLLTARALSLGAPTPGWPEIGAVMDPTDLWTLPAVMVGAWVGRCVDPRPASTTAPRTPTGSSFHPPDPPEAMPPLVPTPPA